ncbi:MAG: hypothetical protein A2381_00685 [Bdellovibrionales bacterium RIFOXYB1_FULL_37_110]|nr:MAG: hypothetical protein A2417_01540 [Bdellovibrionales bacterium RIFOXYC1_FULL_37_79]OFZ52753.1 MAG: hypothetical protein A2328_10025 [Bdellovibrionales bacterium RIFOXYB2_FULL_36_6]OFZ58735.1 MAG: hypothetical protein A2381_00685 [Bdellovibrionales bacterium RIFOXYB1_FULL_37_110]OFZ64734.1 MAG: hypothetical protein A2577_06685 [Bdellovibrionales bacterium RIFOXYD1_FULL_36_51]
MTSENLNLIEMEEAIELLKTSRPTFYRWLKTGKIKGTKVGKKWKFQKDDVERFMKGETPKINIPVDIKPLLTELETQLKEMNITDIAPEEFDELETCVLYIMAITRAKNASDVHISVQKEEFGGETIGLLRMRIYSQLKIISKFNSKLVKPIIDVWKKWAQLDINVSNIPQDGRILMEFPHNAGSIAGKSFTLANHIVPTLLGESLTSRVLNVESFIALSSLSDLGFTKEEEIQIKKNLNKESGLVLASGPAGSGKTTTLYQCLREINHPDKKIVTIENPVEIIFPWATQIPVNPKVGLTFDRAILSALRSDAEVIMVSDTPNPETIKLVIDAATSGHLMLGTFHAKNTFEMLRRIMDAGKDNLYQVIDSINLLISQRLAKKLCPHCKKETKLNKDNIKKLEELTNGLKDLSRYEGETIYKAVGCDKCVNGYKGRVVFYEILEPNENIKKSIIHNLSTEELMDVAFTTGTTPLVEAGLIKVLKGLTTIEEVVNSLEK